jgi:chemotaxis protein methyltransferase CheR
MADSLFEGMDPAWTMCAVVDGTIATTYAAWPLQIRLAGRAVRIAGVTQVSTHPAHRRRGYLRAVSKKHFETLHEKREVAFAGLHPAWVALYQRYGYDFRDYARETIERRLEQCCSDLGVATVSELTGQLLRDPGIFYRVIGYFSVNVTALFRDPHFYTALRTRVLPMLRTWPHVKIWDAGCATGEELYSLAILLAEGGMSNRARIYATDLSAAALDTARAGIYPLEILAQGGRNYFEFGGEYS